MARVEVAGRWHKGVVDGSNEGRRKLRGEETEGDDDEGDLRCAGGRCRSAPRRPCVNEAGPTSATAARAPASIRARCVSRAATPPRGGARSERTAQRSSPTRSLPSSMKSPRSAVNERDKRTHSGDTPSCSACVERVKIEADGLWRRFRDSCATRGGRGRWGRTTTTKRTNEGRGRDADGRDSVGRGTTRAGTRTRDDEGDLKVAA